MFNRPLLKARAKAVLGKCYARALSTTVVYLIITAVLSFVFKIRLSEAGISAPQFQTMIIFMAVAFAFVVVNLAVNAFISDPLSIGINKFHLDSALGRFSDIGALSYGFKANYKNIVIVLFVKNLLLGILFIPSLIGTILNVSHSGIALTFLGFTIPHINLPPKLLFAVTIAVYLLYIPLLIKYYDWRLVEYILAEDSDVRLRDALSKSTALMRSNRFAAFKLDLSFIGWLFLGSITCGIGNLFVRPYIDATNAQLYLELTGRSTVNADENFSENI